MVSSRSHFLFLLQVLIFEGAWSYSFKPAQYHIQTDKGPDRFFRFQTLNGQYRKEKLYDDGRVVGTYGWVGPDNLLRLFDYIADNDGYRIVRERILKMSPARDHPISNAIPGSRDKFSSAKIKPSVTPIVSEGTPLPIVTRPSILPTETTTLPSIVSSSRPKLRPLFVKKKKPLTRFNNRRRQNYISARDRIKNRQPTQRPKQESQSHTLQQPQRQQQRQTQRQQLQQTKRRRPSSGANNVFLQNGFSSTKKSPNFASNAQTGQKRILDPKHATPMETFGYEDPSGKETINFDLGNQYRKEKVFPDGTVVGEHGYVDPMGILRITTYSSGPKGLQEAKKSYWVGSRSPDVHQ